MELSCRAFEDAGVDDLHLDCDPDSILDLASQCLGGRVAALGRAGGASLDARSFLAIAENAARGEASRKK